MQDAALHHNPSASRQRLSLVQHGIEGSSGEETGRVLVTLLFVDIVASTEKLALVGDRGWARLLAAFRAAVRGALMPFGGREIDAAGDGFLASFDSPSRAVRCAQRIHAAARQLDMSVRAGLHAGEVECDRDGVTGIAVHIGARIAALAAANETLVSSTIKDLVAGSGLVFELRGTHALRGIPGEWPVYAASLGA